jgi:hypothetical protein
MNINYLLYIQYCTFHGGSTEEQQEDRKPAGHLPNLYEEAHNAGEGSLSAKLHFVFSANVFFLLI